jgi:hypothetical protein
MRLPTTGGIAENGSGLFSLTGAELGLEPASFEPAPGDILAIFVTDMMSLGLRRRGVGPRSRAYCAEWDTEPTEAPNGNTSKWFENCSLATDMDDPGDRGNPVGTLPSSGVEPLSATSMTEGCEFRALMLLLLANVLASDASGLTRLMAGTATDKAAGTSAAKLSDGRGDSKDSIID